MKRSKDDKVVAGVIGGIGEATGLPPGVLRVITIIAFVGSFGTLIAVYILCWIFVPLRTGNEPTGKITKVEEKLVGLKDSVQRVVTSGPEARKCEKCGATIDAGNTNCEYCGG